MIDLDYQVSGCESAECERDHERFRDVFLAFLGFAVALADFFFLADRFDTFTAVFFFFDFCLAMVVLGTSSCRGVQVHV